MPYPRKEWLIGMKEDLSARLPLYLSDFNHITNIKLFASILFMFFTSIGPAVSFSSLLRTETENSIGVVEVMLSSAIGGILWSLFAGQPLIIVGVTGPVSILSISIYTLTKAWDINFIPFFAWAQIWAALMHVIMAMSNACDMLSWITRFSCEIFGVLIAVIYLYTGITDSIHAFTTKDATFEAGLWQLFVTLGMCRLALTLYNARQWLVFSARIREIISDYGASISLIFWTGVVYFPRANLIDIQKVETPDEFGTSSGRDWIVDLTDLPLWAVFAAIIPGVIITVLFFFDHNVSSIMAQAHEFKLSKPSAFHWDYFVLGLIMLITGILGIPPVNGLIPQAPLHVSSLLLTKYVHSEDAAGNTVRTHTIIGCLEQRYSNFFQAFFTGLMCFQPFLGLIALIPTAALSGLFIFMGLASFADNQFADRVLLLCTQKKLRRCKHDFYTVCSLEDIQSFTFIQIVLCAGIFGITLTPAAMVFPMLIGILIPFRLITLPKYYDIESLHTLDPFIEEDSHIEEELAKRVIEDNDDEDLAEEREEVDMLIRARSRSNSSVLSDVMNIGVANDGVVNIEMKASHV